MIDAPPPRRGPLGTEENAQADSRPHLELYRILFGPSPTPIWLSWNGAIIYANDACLRLLGAEVESQVVGRTAFEFIHPDFHEDVRRRIESLMTGRPVPVLDEKIVRLDGELRDVEVTAWPIPFGNGTAFQVTLVDISERNHILDAVRSSQKHLRNVLDSLFTFVGVLDPEGRLLEANRAPLDAAGLQPEDVEGRFFADTWWWTHSELVQEQIRKAIHSAQSGISSRFDVSVRMKNDSRLLIDFMLVPMRDAEGNITHLVASAVDITERKTAEEELRGSEERFRAAFDNAAVGIGHLAPDGQWIRINQRYCDILGYTPDELKYTTFQEITHPDDLSADLGLAAQLRDGLISSYTLEKRYIRKDGSIVWVNLTGSAVRKPDGSVSYFIAVVEDISARKEAEQALRRSESELQALANSVPQLVWMANPDGFITWYNRRWYEYTGTTSDEMAGWGWQSVHDPAELPNVLEKWRESITTGKPLDMVFPLRGADGVFHPFLTRVMPVRDHHGRIVRWFGTNTDISEQRATENQLRAANAELEQFAFVAAHDLQEPLRTINIYSELLLRRFASETHADAATFAEYLQTAVRRMESLIRDLLRYSGLLHKDSRTERARVDLNVVFRETLTLFEDQIRSEAAIVEVGALPSITGDPTQLSLLFQNLISNALKYRSPDRRILIGISAERSGREWIVSVSDNGIGFEQQYAERIFGLFRRLHSSEYPGTGLGLAICRRIVEAHGGRIWAQSEPGFGSRFFVAFPADSNRGTGSI